MWIFWRSKRPGLLEAVAAVVVEMVIQSRCRRYHIPRVQALWLSRFQSQLRRL